MSPPAAERDRDAVDRSPPGLTRRDFIAHTALGVAALGTGCEDLGDGEPGACPRTPPEGEGPFWVAGVPVRSVLDLYSDPGVALTLEGTVTDQDCVPVADAIVEIWHADPAGLYDNESPDQRYRGQQSTDAEGRFAFETLQPGKYPGRPLHIHIKIWLDGTERLTTQLYFSDDPASDHHPTALRVARQPAGPDAVRCVWTAAL